MPLAIDPALEPFIKEAQALPLKARKELKAQWQRRADDARTKADYYQEQARFTERGQQVKLAGLFRAAAKLL